MEQALHFVDAVDGVDVADDMRQLVVGMYSQGDVELDDAVYRLGLEFIHREVKGLGDAAYDVDEEMDTVDGADKDVNGVQLVGCGIVVGHDAVAMLRGEFDGHGAVALMEREASVITFESHDLLAGDGRTDGAAGECRFGLPGEPCPDGAAGLVGDHRQEPVGVRVAFVGGKHFHHVATVELSVDRCQETVDTGILGMLAEVGMHLVGEVEHGGLLRQHHGAAVGGEGHDVVIIKGGDDVFDEVGRRGVGAVAEHTAEFLNPTADGVLMCVAHAPYLRLEHHPFAGDMHLLPAPEVSEEFEVETLVSVLFRGVDIVGDTAWFLLESVSEQ